MKKRWMRALSAILSIMLVVTMLVPMQAQAATKSIDQIKDEVREHLTPLLDEEREWLEQQVRVSSQEQPTVHEQLLQAMEKKEKGPLSIIVHLSERPVAVAEGLMRLNGETYTSSDEVVTRRAVVKQQQQVKQALQKRGVNASWTHTYSTVLNGFATTIDAKQLPTLLATPGVTHVEPDVQVRALEEPTYDTQISMIETPQFLDVTRLWKEGITGKGVKVAVLDTGIDPNHPDLKPVYKGGKNFVPFDPNTYREARADDDASETRPEERAPEARPDGFETTHGTHVAGTIAAVGNNAYNVKGLAPDVDLYAYRVLGAYGSGYTSSIIAGIEEAVKEEMDVINLSLGGGINTEIDAGSFAINNAALQGVTAVIATGNSGSQRETMGTPATAALGIAVGNSTKPEDAYEAKVTIDSGNFTYDDSLPLMMTTLLTDLSEQLDDTYELVAVPNVGTEEDFSQVDVEGKVAVVVRGDIPFFTKMENARDAGAKAIIIYNSETGSNAPGIADVHLGESFEAIPVFDMSYTDGQALFDALQENEGTFKVEKVTAERSDGDEMAPSSSRGPSIPHFDIKPDVVAPGSNILSTVPVFEGADYKKAYDVKTGTSMATPHVAGVVALLLQKHPEWTPMDVKLALSNTAQLLDTETYDVFDQGAGRVHPTAAIDPEVFVYTEQEAWVTPEGERAVHKKGTMALGYVEAEEGRTHKRELIFQPITKRKATYRLSIDLIKNDTDAKVSLDTKEVTVANGKKERLVFSVEDTTGKKGEVQGYIRVYNHAGNFVATVPFAIDFGAVAPTKVGYFGSSMMDLPVNDEEMPIDAFVYYQLTGPVGMNYIEVIDLEASDIAAGELARLGYIHHSFGNQEGTFDISWDGTYIPWNQKTERVALDDGVYLLSYNAEPLTGRPEVASDMALPIYVKSTAPTFKNVTYDEKTKVVTGQLEDQYFDLVAVEEALTGSEADMNDKLQLSYTVQRAGKETELQLVDVARDGTFSFEVKDPVMKNDTVALTVKDAAGYVVQEAAYGELQEIVPEEEKEPVQLRDIQQTVAYEAIQALADEEIVFGDKEGYFHPHRSITRAEFAVMLARSLSLEPSNTYKGTFRDLPASRAWAYPSIEALADVGIVHGTTDQKFHPDQSITREEVATFLIRALAYEKDGEYMLVAKPKPFRDDAKISGFAKDAVYQAVGLQLVHGNGGYFLPKNEATRGESAMMLYRFLQK